MSDADSAEERLGGLVAGVQGVCKVPSGCNQVLYRASTNLKKGAKRLGRARQESEKKRGQGGGSKVVITAVITVGVRNVMAVMTVNRSLG